MVSSSRRGTHRAASAPRTTCAPAAGNGSRGGRPRDRRGGTAGVGYTATFLSPAAGRDALTRRMAGQCRVQYGKRAEAIDAAAKTVTFDDGSRITYDVLLATLPLNVMVQMAGADA